MPYLSDVTLLIPTYQRPILLAGLLRYLTSQEHRFKILIGDGSSPEIQAQNVATAAAYGDDVQHFGYSSDFGVAKRTLDMLRKVTTRYALFCADDDAVIPAAAAQAVEFLDSHPDFVACHGTYFGVRLKEPGKASICVESATIPIDAADSFPRMLQLFARYQAVTYAVIRTDAFLTSWPPAEVQAVHFWELYQTLAVALQGKIMGLGIPYSFRNQQVGDRPDFIGEPCNYIVADSSGYLENLTNFRKIAADEFARISQDGADWLRRVDLLYFVLLSRALDTHRIMDRIVRQGIATPAEATNALRACATPNTTTVDSQFLGTLLQPLLAIGWPYAAEDNLAATTNRDTYYQL